MIAVFVMFENMRTRRMILYNESLTLLRKLEAKLG